MFLRSVLHYLPSFFDQTFRKELTASFMGLLSKALQIFLELPTFSPRHFRSSSFHVITRVAVFFHSFPSDTQMTASFPSRMEYFALPFLNFRISRQISARLSSCQIQKLIWSMPHSSQFTTHIRREFRCSTTESISILSQLTRQIRHFLYVIILYIKFFIYNYFTYIKYISFRREFPHSFSSSLACFTNTVHFKESSWTFEVIVSLTVHS